MTVALPMYDLPEVTADHEALWAVLRGNIAVSGGLDLPTRLHRPLDLHRSWESPDLMLSQTCGYPLVAALGAAHVIGAFVHRDLRPGDSGDAAMRAGHYRSVVVSRRAAAAPARAGEWLGLRAAVNDRWSLSGWISLLAGADLRAPWPGEVLVTGGHRASLAALRGAEADVASIDPVTFDLLEQHAPGELDGIVVVGRGPAVPALPLITGRAELVGPWRQALHVTVLTSTLEPSLRRLGIDGFVPFDRGDYDLVAALARSVVDAPPAWSGSQRSSSDGLRTSRNGGA